MSKKRDKERKQEIKDKLTDGQIEIQPFYHDLRNEIVQPRNIIVETKYFWDKWKPRLGPTLTVIIMELRRRCYYNPETGERRDYCWPSLQTIADACGISVSTLQRELKRPEAKLFIRIEPRYIYNEKISRMSRTSNIYYVAMDDPLLPEDKDRLKDEIAEQIIEKEGLQRDFELDTKDQPEKDSGHKGQFDDHIAWSICTSKRSLEEIPESLNDAGSSNADKSQERNKGREHPYSDNNRISDISTQTLNKENEESSRTKDIDPLVDIVAHEIAEELRDIESINFYRLVVLKCPTGMIYKILAQVKDAERVGAIKTTPARLFTAAIKNAAKEAGIDLTSKIKFKRRREWGPKAKKPWRLASELAEELDDIKGMAYYNKVAKECPVRMLRWCLEEVKRQGRTVENKGALFNFLVKREMNALESKKQEEGKMISPEDLHIRIVELKKQLGKEDVITIEKPRAIDKVEQEEQRRDVKPRLGVDNPEDDDPETVAQLVRESLGLSEEEYEAEKAKALAGKSLAVEEITEICEGDCDEGAFLTAKEEMIAEDIAKTLGDYHSWGFFHLVVRYCPSDMIYRNLGLVKEEQNIKRNRGAMFTYLIKKDAAELGIDLSGKDNPEPREWGEPVDEPKEIARILAKKLDDPEALAFYHKAAKLCPLKMLRWAYFETMQCGRRVKNKAAYFNRLLLFKMKQAGADFVGGVTIKEAEKRRREGEKPPSDKALVAFLEELRKVSGKI